MKNEKQMLGKIIFINLETGYWALLVGSKKYRIKNIPTELKRENITIEATVSEIDNEMSIYITNNPIKINKYKIIN